MTGKQFVHWLGRFLPPPHNVPDREQARAAFGAALGLGLTALLSFTALGANLNAVFLIAPMGASAVLVFGVPASPLAQPWSVVGGNVVSALVGITCARLIEAPMLAAPLAGSLAIVAMFLMRCLHPPGGAVALTAVLAGPAVHAAGYHFALVPVCLNSSLLVLAGLVYNNVSGRRYPHLAHSPLQNVHDTRDVAPTGPDRDEASMAVVPERGNLAARINAARGLPKRQPGTSPEIAQMPQPVLVPVPAELPEPTSEPAPRTAPQLAPAGAPQAPHEPRCLSPGMRAPCRARAPRYAAAPGPKDPGRIAAT